ncbi:MAG: 16S rRNA (cytosine(967)-C(5))-methyltransferase RsmB [Rhodocyclaceae bacterium]|nr:16S rRNA (cytosine(967)-C(5))-methyltransferase RsmB [Rhodocyclaceae bacterium]
MPARRKPAFTNPTPRRPKLPPDSLALSLFHAAHLVAAVRDGNNLTQQLSHLWSKTPDMDPGQRGAIQDLSYSTLRAWGYGERLLAPLLRTPPPEPLHALLLVAACRLEQRPDQAHTVVDQAVSAAGQILAGKLSGMVNGVLRNLLRRHEELAAQAQANPEGRYRHPQWWLDRMTHRYPANWEAVADAANRPPPMALRPNRRRTAAATLQAQLEAEGIEAVLSDEGALLLAHPLPVSRIPGFAEGLCSVQDPGAQRAARWLDLADGQRVLDACAAPGGKTAHILELADVQFTALELAPDRATRIRENLDRLGLTATIQVADCRDTAAWWDGQPFDRILADVPCSASGVARRHPDIKWLRREADIAGFAREQATILHQLWQTLRVGGKMLYATCSIFEEENTAQLAAFCAHHPDAHVLSLEGSSEQQLLPCADHDGFYYALLEKTG